MEKIVDVSQTFDYKNYIEYTIINGRVLYDKNKSLLFKKIPQPKRMF